MSTNPLKVIEKVIEGQDKIADFVANGPSTGLGGHVRNEYRKRCDQFANLPGWAQALGNGTTGTMDRICTPYWDAGGFDGPVLAPPFTGGQCAATYSASVIRNFNGTVVALNPNTLMGPITGFTQSVVGAGPSNTVEVRATITAAGGTATGSFFLPQGNFTLSQNWALIGGGADNCGDPPAEPAPGPNPPPDPGPTAGPEPTDDPNDPTGIPLLPIPDYDDPLGGPTPIVAPDETGGGVDPTDIPGNTDSAPGGGENIGDPIMVDPGPGGGGDDTDFGEPPTGKVWVGALLQFAIPTDYGIIPGSGPANPVVQRVFGNASLVFENGRGTAYRVNSGNIDLIRPSGALKVTGVYVNCLPGITYNIRPVSLDLCPENNCSQE